MNRRQPYPAHVKVVRRVVSPSEALPCCSWCTWAAVPHDAVYEKVVGDTVVGTFCSYAHAEQSEREVRSGVVAQLRVAYG